MKPAPTSALVLPLLLLASTGLGARTRDRAALVHAIQAIANESGARIGVAAMRFDGSGQDSFQLNGAGRFPMQSVYKFPLALAVLDRVQTSRLWLGQQLPIRRADLDSNTWSPMLKEQPDSVFSLSASALLGYAVSKSDNNACDLLFRLIGGPKAAQGYLDRSGVQGIRIVSTEREMHVDSDLQYQNWSTPAAMLRLLGRFERNQVLNKPLCSLLREMMTKTENSPRRIGGLLPEVGYQLAHKTGTSFTNAAGITAAVNDVGILSLGAKRLGIVVFVSDLKGSSADGERIIARISRELWDYYMAD